MARTKTRHTMRANISMTNDDAGLVARAERAEQASRAREMMLASVSHDLRDPLSAIAMLTNLLAGEFAASGMSARVNGHLSAMMRTTERMQRLVNDLLDADALEVGQVRLDTFAALVDTILLDVIHLLLPAANAKGVQMEIDIAENISLESQHIWCDRDRIMQIFANLGGNAIKFTPPGGRVRISATRTHDRAGLAVITFGVEDTGSGIAPHELEHVFDRYWQSPATARLGTGLGLSIARALVHAHRGCIEVHSAPGRGSKFAFTIPLTREMHRAGVCVNQTGE